MRVGDCKKLEDIRPEESQLLRHTKVKETIKVNQSEQAFMKVLRCQMDRMCCTETELSL